VANIAPTAEPPVWRHRPNYHNCSRFLGQIQILFRIIFPRPSPLMIHMLILLRTTLPNLDVSRGKESRNICNRWRNSSRIGIPKIITTYNVAQGFSIKCYRTCQMFALRLLHDLLRPFGAYFLQVAPVSEFYKSPQSWPPMVQYPRIYPRETFLLPKPCHMYSANPPLIVGT